MGICREGGVNLFDSNMWTADDDRDLLVYAYPDCGFGILDLPPVPKLGYGI